MRLFKKKRQCKLVYNKSSEKYYGAWNSLRLHDDEVLIDEYMTEDEAGDMAKRLNKELGGKVYYHDATYMVMTKHNDEKKQPLGVFKVIMKPKSITNEKARKTLNNVIL